MGAWPLGAYAQSAPQRCSGSAKPNSPAVSNKPEAPALAGASGYSRCYRLTGSVGSWRVSPDVAGQELDHRSRTSLNVKALDVVQLGGPFLAVGRTVFEMWLGNL